MIEEFGINAGIVWSLLNETGRQNLKDVKKATKFTDKKLYAALGLSLIHISTTSYPSSSR